MSRSLLPNRTRSGVSAVFLLRTSITALAVLLLAAPAADAQYFGRNQVQYQTFDFQVLRTENFDIYYYEEEAEAVQLAARMVERWNARLSKVLRHQLRGRQPLILYASQPHFRQTNAIGGEPGEGTGGVTEAFKRRIVLPFAGGLAETDHVLGHELVHAYQFDMTVSPEGGGLPRALALPLWFVEGMAEYLSIGPIDSFTAMWLRDAVAREDLPTVRRLNRPEYFPYRYGHAFWAYVAGRWGDDVIGDMLQVAARQGVDTAIETVLGIDHNELSEDWHAALRKLYAPVIETTRPAEAFGEMIISRDRNGGRLNIAPTLSPDGSRLAFLSERDLFSIDLFLADARTGRVIRRLARTATDPHFESLQFLSSAGTWSPDGTQFMFAGLARGRPVLRVLNAENGRTVRTIEMQGVDEIYNPHWSPDGRRVVFSGIQGGTLDLYLTDMDGKVERLTNDMFATIDPKWSPDGRRVAFVTDRFSSDIDQLAFGNYRLAIVDVETRRVQPLGGFPEGRNINPRWTPDGRSVVFIGEPDGIANLYRLDLGTGQATKLTDIRSGVSGITALSPALSVAQDSGRVAFTAFEGNEHRIFVAESPEALHGDRVLQVTDRRAAELTPTPAGESAVAALLARPATGLPTEAAIRAAEIEDYRARLSLDHVTQPTVGVGFDRFGAFAQGGIAFLFSDMLGDHSLITALQVSGEIQDIGGGAFYVNRRGRWNWGALVDRTPYVTGGFSSGFVGNTFVEQEFRFREINHGLTGIAQYPLSRVQRVEFSGGVRRISFDREVRVRQFDPFTGRLISEDRTDLPSPDAINLGETSAALVYDTSVSGLVGPLAGQRYRMEVSQLSGTLNFTGLLADYRRYFMPVRPFTLAGRVLHYGRYGSGGEDPRLGPLYVGYPYLVRGYGVGSFQANECPPSVDGTCPVFDNLLGSRIAVANAEVRFPPFGLFTRGSYYGPLPIELAIFGDAGVAWDSETQPRFAGGERDWVRSAGLSLRANAFGFAIVELAYVRPFDRPNRGWLWQFNFTPAF
jgi:Tol biopolymer transport system component